METERLLLRRWRDSDRDPFASLNADPLVMRYFSGCLKREESDALIARIEAHFEQHGFGPFAAELKEEGSFIGFIGLSIPRFKTRFTPCVEIGWRLAPAYWNRGLATEGARACLHFGFEMLKLDEIVSFTAQANAPSRRVMEKLGMTRNPADDFDHPQLSPGDPLRRHVLYRIRNSNHDQN